MMEVTLNMTGVDDQDNVEKSKPILVAREFQGRTSVISCTATAATTAAMFPNRREFFKLDKTPNF